VTDVDLKYRFALFAQRLAARCGVPGVASPSEWEERAVADYERLALRAKPNPAACHRLGVIYARRGYLRQGREMLTQAMTHDEESAEAYWALLLVYSEDPIRARDVGRVRAALQRQPRWLALWTLGDLAARVEVPGMKPYFEAQAREDIWRFGATVSLAYLVGLIVIATSLIAVLVAALTALFRRNGHARPWPTVLPPLKWVDVFDVPALAMFCNALGQVARDNLASVYAPNSAADVGLRVAHVLFAVVPPLILVLGRAGVSPFGWSRALGLVSHGLRRHLFQALVGLGIALTGAVLTRDVLVVVLRIMLPGMVPGAMGAQALPVAGVPAVAADCVLLVLVAPLVEEIIFRGFLFQTFLYRLRPVAAVGLSAILFAGTHLAWDPQTFLPLFCLGMVSAYMYLSSRSLIPCILLHAGYNAAILTAGLIVRM